MCYNIHIVVATTPSKNFSYTQILEPTMDLVIGFSVVTSWLVDAFDLPSWIGSLKGTYSYMLSLQQVHESILLCKLEQA